MKYESIRVRNGKTGVSYQVVIKYTVDGQRKTYTKTFRDVDYGGKAKALESAKVHRNTMKTVLKETPVNQTDISVMDLLEQSFDVYPIALRTQDKLIKLFNKYFPQHGMAFKDVKPSDIQLALNKMARTCTDDTIKRFFSIWKRLYKTAIFKDLAFIDNTIKVTVPKSEVIRTPKEMRTSIEDLKAITERIEMSRTEDKEVIINLLWVLYYTGLRPSEAEALEQKNIDREHRLIKVVQAIGSDATNNFVVKRVKTANSIRVVPYPPEMDQYLDSSDQFLFKRSNGEFLNTTYLSNILRRYSNGTFRAYQLRHLYSTDMLNSGVDIRTVQELMGHTSSVMTLEYARSSEERKKEAVNKRISTHIED